MAHEPKQTQRERRGVAVLLAWVAGYVDGVGYLVLLSMFTSHMSGNTIAGAVHLGSEHWSEAFHRLFPIALFVVGVACGRALMGVVQQRRVRSLFAVAFLAEVLLLSLFLICGLPCYRDGGIRPESVVIFYLLAALPALAMGFQNSTLRRVGGQTIRTTYITGGLTDMTEEAVDYLYWRLGWPAPAGPPVGAERQPSLMRVGILLAIWLGYLLGGVVGALSEQRWQLSCLLVPIGCLALLTLLDLISPLAE